MLMIADGSLLDQAMHRAVTDPRTYLLRFYPRLPIPPLDHVATDVEPLTARVRHGIWTASCPCGTKGRPRPGCVVWFDQPIGWCVRCRNRAVGGAWRPIVVPGPEMRAAIEAVLLCRPKDEDRNWEASESLADLIAQNKDHGDPVPQEVA